MSLIGDALRRARQDAAEREKTARGVVIRRVNVAPPAHPGARRSLVVGVLVGAAVPVVVLVAWLLPGRTPPPEPRAGAAAPTIAAAPAPSGDRAPDTAAPAPKGTMPAPLRAAGESAAPVAATPPSRSDREPPHFTAGAPASGPVHEPAAGSTQGDRVYVLDADLGYARLHLDFLVYKPSAPFGRINGQDIVPGSVVDGFRVEEIGPDFVRLVDRRGPLTLRVH